MAAFAQGTIHLCGRGIHDGCMTLGRYGGFECALIRMAASVVAGRRADFLCSFLRLRILRLEPPMNRTPHVCIQCMDIPERDSAVAAPKLRSVHLRLKMQLQLTLASKGAIAVRAEAVACEDAVVQEYVGSQAELVARAASRGLEDFRGDGMVAGACAYVRGEVASGTSVLFQVECIRVGAAAEAVKSED